VYLLTLTQVLLISDFDKRRR